MQITRNVIIDLLPLYLAKEVSTDTQQLIEKYLENDEELSKILNDLSKKELLNTVPNPLTKESKMIALKKANRFTLYRTIIIGLLIGFFATAFVVLVLMMPTL